MATPRTSTLNAIIGRFKSPTSTRLLQARKTAGLPPAGHGLWQRSFYDHIIRDEDDLAEIRLYIEANPEQWESDRLFCASERSTAARRESSC